MIINAKKGLPEFPCGEGSPAGWMGGKGIKSLVIIWFSWNSLFECALPSERLT
jgi:hypothetical protein